MAVASPIPGTVRMPDPVLESVRLGLGDGVGTTLRVARFDRASFGLRVVALEPCSTLLRWCADRGTGAALRCCVHAEDGRVALASRADIPPDPAGDLLQAGPMLVAAGHSLIRPGEDLEGFSAGSGQFDSDITAGRYPRAALGLGGDELIAVVCEGRADNEAGLTMAELAQAMRDLGASEAINLDGGGSASLVVGGRLLNTPREEHGLELVGGPES